MQVEEFLERSARRLPDKLALVCGARRLTYGELDRRANALAHDLAARGVARGDRVAVYLENSVEAVIAIFAILKAGAVFVMVNPTTKPDKLTWILNHCRATGLVADALRLRGMTAHWESLPHLAAVWSAGALPASGVSKPLASLEALFDGELPQAPPPKRSIDADLAALIYTSGTTGKPKGVMVTHLNMFSVATSIETYLENGESDIIMNVLSLAHGYGLYQLLVTFKTGGTLVLERSFAYPYAVVENMLRERVTGFALVPTISAILLQMDLKQYGFPALRYITNAAAAWPVQHMVELRRQLPHVRLYSMYGMTECQRVSYLPPGEVDIRPKSVGKGMPNQEVWVADENGNRVGPNVVGELIIRGSHVMRGYWEDPEETGRVLTPGPLPGEKVLHGADLFRMDEEGNLYFVSRKDELIKTRGEKVSPKEIEDVLYSMEGIAEAAVVGVPDAVLGQAIKAVVTLRDGAAVTDQHILRYCAARLEDFMVPKIIEFRDGLPKSANGKIMKRELVGAAGGAA